MIKNSSRICHKPQESTCHMPHFTMFTFTMFTMPQEATCHKSPAAPYCVAPAFPLNLRSRLKQPQKIQRGLLTAVPVSHIRSCVNLCLCIFF